MLSAGKGKWRKTGGGDRSRDNTRISAYSTNRGEGKLKRQFEHFKMWPLISNVDNITTGNPSFHWHNVFSKRDISRSSYRQRGAEVVFLAINLQLLITIVNDSDMCSLDSEFSSVTQIQGLDGGWLKGWERDSRYCCNSIMLKNVQNVQVWVD